MAFKQDEDFLRFITMGAAGSAAVSHNLREAHGHATIELERYAMANKIWATKIKRLRLADLVCLACGRRIEARAKSDLRVRMSHSDAVGREWDAGLRDDDLCAFVPWADGAVSGPPEYFTVGEMRATARYAKFGTRKAASEGAERDMTWPMQRAARDGIVESLDLFGSRVTLLPFQGRRQRLSMRDGIPAIIYVRAGEKVRGAQTFVVGCLDKPKDLRCPGEAWDIEADLHDSDASTRYAAVKAVGFRGDSSLMGDLLDIAADEHEDGRIRLEAWASLARIDSATYTSHIAARAQEPHSRDRPLAIAMEAIFILSELGTSEAAAALASLAANRGLDPEARCAAVWGLGVAGCEDPGRVFAFITDEDESVALHALASIGRLPAELLDATADLLDGTDRDAASAAALLTRQGDAGARVLLSRAADGGPAATWALAALGEMTERDVRAAATATLAPELKRMLAPMWAARGSWLSRQAMDTPLRFLERQTIRYLA